MTKIIGQAKASAYQMSEYLLSKNKTPKFSRDISALDFCKIFLNECAKENIRGDIAFAQACKETGNFNYGGDVHYTQNNFAGIGATGNKNPGNTFDTIEIGVLAQAQHLKSYATKDELNEPNVDPRRTAWFMNTKGGSSPDVETLGGSWAVPGYNTVQYKSLEEANNAKDSYGYQIITILNNILNVTDEKKEGMPMTINKLLTPYNYTSGNISRIKYIVIHFVGATGGAEANCKYYASQKLSASAHYFVGHSGEIWQSVEDKNVAWHCGGKKYANTTGGTYHGICTNANSIGIEMCVRKDSNGNWYFEDATVESTIALTKELMKKYNIPADNVIRHFDVNGKPCGYPYVYNNTKHTWNDFKSAIINDNNKNNNTKKKYTVGWNQDDKGWWYSPDGNTYYKSEWSIIKGYKYYFNQEGYALTNWQKIDGKWYFFETTKGDFECTLYVSDENGVQAPGKFENKQEKTGTVYNCSSLNVRSKASASSDKITSLDSGTKVTILDESNDWYYVSSNGVKGWVSGKYIKLN